MSKRRRAHSTLDVSTAAKPPVLVRWGLFRYHSIGLVIGITEQGRVCRLTFANEAAVRSAGPAKWEREWPRTEFVKDAKAVAPFVKKILLGGKLPILLVGTEFQRAVWRGLLSVPYGQVVSYGEIARRAKRPKAVRAVGSACGANPVAVLVPCHRIIAGDGSLGGFGGGLEIKRRLLKMEGVLGAVKPGKKNKL